MTTPNYALLQSSNLQQQAPEFQKYQLQDYLPAFQQALLLARDRIAAIRSQSAAATFDNTILALETCSDEMQKISALFHCLYITDATEEMHPISREMTKLSTDFASDVSLDQNLFLRVQEVWDRRKEVDLRTEEEALLRKTYKSFERNGAKLAEAGRDQVRSIDQELAQLSLTFSENQLKAVSEYGYEVADSTWLDGLPDWFVQSAQAKAKSKGKLGFLLTLDAPSFMSVMKYATNRKVREDLWRAYSSRCTSGPHDNRAIVVKMVQLRHQRAQLLGYRDHAHYVLEERMAQNPEKVQKFLEELNVHSKPAALREMAELHSFSRSEGGPSDLMPWDTAFYSEKLKTQKYSIDQESLRPYFSLQNVLDGAFHLAQRLYGVEFRHAPNLPVYHPEANVYEVWDRESNSSIGLLYTDFFPRDSKRSGAWCMTFREQGLSFGAVRRPQLGIVGNFTRPTADHGSLLTFDEVRTLFHEFGHALHGLFSDCHFRTTGGLNVFWDFVELPSQFMENWVFEPEVLRTFAKHHKTGELIPDHMIQKIRESSNFLAGLTSLRQLTFGILDLAWHSGELAGKEEVMKFEYQTIRPYLVLPQIDGASISCSFSHIFAGGYSAGYYSYKWAEVLEADAFSYFKETGLFNPVTAQKFRNEILSRGGTLHPMQLYTNFRGREPDILALLHREGLLPNTAPGETR